MIVTVASCVLIENVFAEEARFKGKIYETSLGSTLYIVYTILFFYAILYIVLYNI